MTAERERLAREIHDTLAHGLTSIQLLLRAAGRALEKEQAGDTAAARAAARSVEQAQQAAQDNLAEARHFVHELAPPDLDGKGASLAGALLRLCATTSVRHDVAVRFHESGERTPLPPGHETALLRIAQSALANTVAHAAAQHAEVTLSHLGDQVALDVVDDGDGFAPESVVLDPSSGRAAANGYGLRAMRARAQALGGAFTVESAPGRGTAIAVQLPVAEARAAERKAS
jgi:signal transduction histidine kinase